MRCARGAGRPRPRPFEAGAVLLPDVEVTLDELFD